MFYPKYNISLAEERQLAYDRLKKICDSGLFSVKDFWKNPRNIFTAHEITGQVDPSTTTKLTVQFNLFGGTVLKLGTDYHHKILDSIDKYKNLHNNFFYCSIQIQDFFFHSKLKDSKRLDALL